jgi:hypothetical protein
MQKITDKFTLRSARNTNHPALTLQNQINTNERGDPTRQYVGGVKEYRLADGRHLNWINENVFEIATTGERLTRV